MEIGVFVEVLVGGRTICQSVCVCVYLIQPFTKILYTNDFCLQYYSPTYSKYKLLFVSLHLYSNENLLPRGWTEILMFFFFCGGNSTQQW